MKLKLKDILVEFKRINIGSLYSPVAVGRFGIRKRNEIYKKELSQDYSKNKIIGKNDLVIGMGSNQIDVGILFEDNYYSVSPAYHTYKINTMIVNPEWLDYLFKENNKHYFTKHAIHSARQGKTINLEGLLEESVCVPSLEKQTNISSLLNKINNLISQERNLILEIDELIKSRFMCQEANLCIVR